MMSPEPKSISAVPLLDVNRGNSLLRDEILQAIAEVVDSGRFLHGPQVGELESTVATICNTKHAIACASGSDALLLALMAFDIQPGDEVIVPSFTFFATASAVSRLGAIPVFVDIDPKTFNICPDDIADNITSRTKAIIPVHLFGQCADMERIMALANRHHIHVIEDAAQAIGAKHMDRPAGNWGDVGCLSFYPTKNLGGMGDGGMLVCNNTELANRLRLMASHGMQPRYYHKCIGINSRLDTIQAAILNVKIRLLDSYTAARQKNAERYGQLFEESGLSKWIELPYQSSEVTHVWNQYGIRIPHGQRDTLRKYLSEHQIGSEVYYPVPLHLQECYQELGYPVGSLPKTERIAKEILHLPIYPEMTAQEQECVVRCIGRFYASASMRRAA